MVAAGAMPERVADDVRALEGLNIDALRDEWRRRFKAPPPALRAPDLMRRLLADRIQTEALGRDEELERRLATLVRAYGRGQKVSTPQPIFRPGTVLVREHQGRTHRVEVLDEGFLWEGRNYGSLSLIAREITGVRWNGPRFFGLREAKAAGASR
ncbi:MAG TPA: DUF2924 domain-containing protein [Caulobacteraceae bacterium]|jgi:hypothetical protein|nr:DUF2924 domain-containing protein [Caulobacteraceae bacterium]